MTADSGDADAMAHAVVGAPGECWRCGEGEALQDEQASDNRRDDNTRRWESICPAWNHATFDISSKGWRQCA
jgi:hypothetical protein